MIKISRTVEKSQCRQAGLHNQSTFGANLNFWTHKTFSLSTLPTFSTVAEWPHGCGDDQH